MAQEDPASPIGLADSAPAPSEFPLRLNDWDNLKVLDRNILPLRAPFFQYENADEALTRDVARSKSQLLSGMWLFNLSKSPSQGPVNFHQRTFTALKSIWGTRSTIAVPHMWQLRLWQTPAVFPCQVPFPRLPAGCN